MPKDKSLISWGSKGMNKRNLGSDSDNKKLREDIRIRKPLIIDLITKEKLFHKIIHEDSLRKDTVGTQHLFDAFMSQTGDWMVGHELKGKSGSHTII